MKLCLNPMMRRPCSAILGLVLGLCACVGCSTSSLRSSSSSDVLYVAPSGSDSNPGTLSQPFLTIQKCATTVASGGTCEVRAGTYHETVTPNSGITTTSYNGESVTVDGTGPVTGWTLYQGSIYQASVSMSSGDTNQVFVGSQMMTEARWPNGDDLFHVNWETAQAGTTDTLLVDPNLPNINWTGAHIHFWSGTDPWYHLTATVTASSSGQLTFSLDDNGTLEYCPQVCPAAGGYYYVFGVLGALDTANEWFYDSSAGVLYFWAPGGVNPNTLNVSAKQRTYGFDLSGKSNVTIENINLFACSISTNANSTNNTFNGISAQYISHFTTLKGGAGGYSDSGIILSGIGNSLINSRLAYSAGNGVAVVNGSNATIKNNLIHHVDYMGDEDGGVVAFAKNSNYWAQNVTIKNNTIYAAGRAAIDMNWNQDPVQVGPVEIGYNNLFDGMMYSNDGGEIYLCCGAFSGSNSIDHNWIHDTHAFVLEQISYPLGGVYIDGGSSGWAVNQNVIWNNAILNVLVNGENDPNNNPVSNNTIPDINSTGYIGVATAITNCGTTQIVNNKVVVPVDNLSSCPASNNNASAPGATEMTSSVQVGCNFTGCSSEAPPAISGNSVAASIAVQPQSVTVNPGQTATFTVTAAGSPTLSYQWQMNGTNISGATAASYTTAPTTTANNGEVFTVQVSNSIGGATSAPATLTVQ